MIIIRWALYGQRYKWLSLEMRLVPLDCYCASITMAGKKPACLLVRTSIRSIPPSRDLTKLLITCCPAQSRTLHVHRSNFRVGPKSKCVWELRRAATDRWVCKLKTFANCKTLFQVCSSLCHSALISSGGLGQKVSFVLQSYFWPPLIICSDQSKA